MVRSAALPALSFLLLAASPAASQEAYPVKDIVPGPTHGAIQDITAEGRRAFFTVVDDAHGRELWKTDGSAAGTQLVRDIVPGNGSSSFGPLCATPGLVFFIANDPVVGWEPFRSDGSEAGTYPVGDLTPGTNLGSFSLTCAGGFAFFARQVAGGIAELWRTDGTAAGTIPLTSAFIPGPLFLTAVNGTLFFWASTSGVNGSLWKSDGTPAGTVEVKAFPVPQTPADMVGGGQRLFFTIDDGIHGLELWVSDGTGAGTALVKDIVPGDGYPAFFGFQPVGSRLFFVANDLVNGAELWVSDGTAGGTVRLDIVPGAGSGSPRWLVSYLGEAFFVISDENSTDSIWRSDGTPAGTRQVVQIAPAGQAADIRFLTPVKEKLFFVAEDPAGGDEPWRSDGTAAGTARAADIQPGPAGSFPSDLAGAGRRLFMAADDGVNGAELWAAPVSAFADVAPLDPFWSFIHALYDAGVTGGCATAPLRYCPQQAVSRETMAVLLLRAREGAAYTPPACTPPGPFADVPCDSPYAAWIQELAARAVTGGCSAAPPAYCPSASVDRAQMAVFLLRMAEGPAYLPPPCTVPTFADVPCSDPFAPWIEELVRRGITSGCGGGNYCPATAVTRAQMAVFLTVTFALPLP
jgi:ELWxxDGT repeat protein